MIIMDDETTEKSRELIERKSLFSLWNIVYEKFEQKSIIISLESILFLQTNISKSLKNVYFEHE